MTVTTLETQLASDASVYQTPCFVYAASQIRDNYSRLKLALGTALMLSIKANHCTDLLHLIRTHIDGFEVASEFELTLLALLKSELGFINNPSMSPDLMRKAVAARVTITIDHPQQIATLVPLKHKLKPVCLRLSSALFLNPGEPVPKRLDHFGMDRSALRQAISLLKAEGIQVAGIHVFRGSHSFENCAFDTVAKLPAIIDFIETELGYPLQIVNLGGGFSEPGVSDQFDFAAYRTALNALSQYQLLHESGRAIFASAGYFICSVVAVKTIHEQVVIICDGGMAQNFLLAQTEKTIRQWPRPHVCHLQAPSGQTLQQPAKIVGSSCNREDVIGQLPAGVAIPQVGDRLIFSDCGAYNRTYSPTQFLGLVSAREYLLDQ